MTGRDIGKITYEQAEGIIDTRVPFGLFCVLKDGVYVGIDNSNGHAWTEAFSTLRECRRWLGNPNIEIGE
jgi:hypothetical protein